MKNLFIICVLLSVIKLSAQELKATMVSDDEVTLEIHNPKRYYFNMPYTEYLPYELSDKKTDAYYSIIILFYKGDNIFKCENIMESPPGKMLRFDKTGSGFYSTEKKIIQTYRIKFKNCEQEALIKEGYCIQFQLIQKNIRKMSVLRESIKNYSRKRLFDGVLYSNKIPLNIHK